jgi:hypothetical protein
MNNWEEHLYENLSRLVANERTAASVSTSPIPIAVGCGRHDHSQ